LNSPVVRDRLAEGGVPDEESQEAFLKKELEGSAPQYDPEGGKETAKEAALIGASFLPGAGIADAAGYMGNPSLKENLQKSRYFDAALQGVGMIPEIGPTLAKGAAGAYVLHKALKMTRPEVAAAMDPSINRMFIGPNARKADLSQLSKAEELALHGSNKDKMRSITEQTGWHSAPMEYHATGVNEQEPLAWWSEISDKPSKMNLNEYLDTKHGPQNKIYQERIEMLRNDQKDLMNEYDKLEHGDPKKSSIADQMDLNSANINHYLKLNPKQSDMELGWSTKLGDVFHHPELYENYPHLADMPLHIEGTNTKSDHYGFYRPSDKSITLASNIVYDNPEEARSTLLHEIQHAIQHREGAESGYNPRLGSVANPEYERWYKSAKSDPEHMEYLQLSNSKEHQEALENATNMWAEVYLPKIKELKTELDKYGRKTPEREAVWNKINAVSDAYNADRNELFPVLKRASELSTSLENRGISPKANVKQFLEPWEAYDRSRGEVQARTVQARRNLPTEGIKIIHPEDTMETMERGYPYSKQVFRRANYGYDANAVEDALRLAKSNRKE
jgi:hypothetical protein